MVIRAVQNRRNADSIFLLSMPDPLRRDSRYGSPHGEQQMGGCHAGESF